MAGDDEFRNTKNYDFYEMAVFDQDGNALNYVENIGQGDLQCECYSLRGKDISKLHIYITQNEEDALELMTAKTEKRAKEISEYDFVVDVKQLSEQVEKKNQKMLLWYELHITGARKEFCR